MLMPPFVVDHPPGSTLLAIGYGDRRSHSHPRASPRRPTRASVRVSTSVLANLWTCCSASTETRHTSEPLLQTLPRIPSMADVSQTQAVPSDGFQWLASSPSEGCAPRCTHYLAVQAHDGHPVFERPPTACDVCHARHTRPHARAIGPG